MSHEIRTPLNALIGTAYLLRNSTLDAKQQADLKTIDTAGKNLMGLINDVLDLSKIEAGELEIDRGPFSLPEVLGDLQSLFAPLAASKGLDFQLGPVPPEINAKLVGDANRLRQCLNNLLSNALKFTEQGDVSLSVQCQEAAVDDPPSTLRLSFAVSDSGVGIAESHLPRLFSPFQQADTSTTRRFGGTGLGLSIVKCLVDLMGGRITVESRLGQGSTFRLELPFGTTDLPVEAPAESISRPLNLLVVDDEAADRAILARIARSFGWAVEEVASGSEMIERVRGESLAGRGIDCILLDWRLPELDGVQALEALQSQIGDQRMPSVVMVTAADKAALLGALKALPEDKTPGVLSKPVEPSLLFNAVNEAVVAHGYALDHLLGFSDLDAEHCLWLSEVRVLAVDDSHLNLDVIGRILMQEGARPTLCDSGQEALTTLNRATEAFDLILMDLQMPGMDGCETTVRIRNQAGLAEIPVIALTAGATLTEQQRAREAGMDGFLTKPVDPKVLVRTIRRHVEQRRGAPLPVIPKVVLHSAPEAPSSADTTAWPDLPELAIADARRTFGEDREFYLGLVERFLGECDALIGAARQSLLAGDQAGASRPIHRLRGQAGNIAAKTLAALAGELEELALAGTLTVVGLDRLEGDTRRLMAAYRAWSASHHAPLKSITPVSADAVAPGLTPTVDREKLTLLRTQLQERQMAAMTTAGEIAAALRASLGEEDYQAFNNAISGLQFAAAAAILDKLS